MLPSEFPELQGNEEVRRLLTTQVDMQFGDAEALLQLPRPGDLSAGCNLTLAGLLFALIGGASVFFYRADIAYFKRYKASGRRFKQLMRDFYPWQNDDACVGKEAASLLYTFARNPLTHSFGIGKAAELFPGAVGGSQTAIWLAKAPLSPSEAQETLTGAALRPEYLPPTLSAEPGGIILNVHTLAWGTAAMFRGLFRDPAEVAAADKLARQLLRGSK